MSMKNAISLMVAIAVALPMALASATTASAQKFISKKRLVEQLQVRKKRPRSRRQATIRQGNGQSVQPRRQRVMRKRAPSKVAKRRAPQVQEMRVPNRQGQVTVRSRAPSKVAKRRAPSRNNNVNQFRAPGKVAKRRAPPRNNDVQHLRVPERQNAGNERIRAPEVRRSRAPSKVAKRRAPPRVAERRAPASSNQQIRVPSKSTNAVVTKRPVNREPQFFGNQVASANDGADQRGIAINSASQAHAGAASVDLEILFEYDSAEINPKSLKQLLELGAALQDAALANTRIVIAGHTDAAGGNEYNVDLSYRRAESVSSFLTTYVGIAPERLTIEGYGEELLKYPDAPRSGQNRRVEIINLDS